MLLLVSDIRMVPPFLNPTSFLSGDRWLVVALAYILPWSNQEENEVFFPNTPIKS